jgi:hypothetical protein
VLNAIQILGPQSQAPFPTLRTDSFVSNNRAPPSGGQHPHSDGPSRLPQQDDLSNSDAESQPRISRQAKGKYREVGNSSHRDEDGMSDVGDPPLGSHTPAYQDDAGGVGPST